MADRSGIPAASRIVKFLVQVAILVLIVAIALYLTVELVMKIWPVLLIGGLFAVAVVVVVRIARWKRDRW